MISEGAALKKEDATKPNPNRRNRGSALLSDDENRSLFSLLGENDCVCSCFFPFSFPSKLYFLFLIIFRLWLVVLHK